MNGSRRAADEKLLTGSRVNATKYSFIYQNVKAFPHAGREVYTG
jgi:hypothetical protein